MYLTLYEHESASARPLHAQPVDSLYVEQFWLPIIGPTSWALARVVERIIYDNEPFGAPRIEISDLADSLSLGLTWPKLQKCAKRVERFTRSWQFDPLAKTIVSARCMSLVPRKFHKRYPPSLRYLHLEWLEQWVPQPVVVMYKETVS